MRVEAGKFIPEDMRKGRIHVQQKLFSVERRKKRPIPKGRDGKRKGDQIKERMHFEAREGRTDDGGKRGDHK